MTHDDHHPASGAGPQSAEITLSSITVQLGLLEVLGPAFLRRHQALPYEVAGETLRLVTPHAEDTLLLDEVAFCTGLRVEAALPRGDGLPKIIEACIEAWSRGEQTFVTTGAGGAVADADLVYLEDLGSLAAPSGPASGAGSGRITFGDAGDLSGLGSVGELADAGAAAGRSPTSGVPADEERPDTGALPAVVDIKPRIPSAQQRAVPAAPQPPGPSAQATSLESGSLEDDDLFDDVDLLGDVDLLEVVDEDDPDSAEQPHWERAPTGVPQHRPAAGMRALLASAGDDERQRLLHIGQTLGFEVVVAERTLDVLEQLEGRTADLLLLDADMEGTHPYAAARQLRAESRHAGLAIALAGRQLRCWSLEEDLHRTYGVDAYLQRPYDTPTLLWTLERALAARRSEPVVLRDPEGVAEARDKLAQGTSLYRKGAIDEAVALFRSGLAVDPFAAKLYVSLAIAQVKLREPYKAMEAFENAVALEPTLTKALQNLAVLYEKKGFRNKAFEFWTRTLHATKEEDMKLKLRARIAKLL